VLFTAAENPQTGELWCNDCERARPYLKPVYSLPQITIIECIIQRTGYVNNPNHPYKKHKDIKLTHIPTLIWWKSSGPSECLVEGELHHMKNINRFLDLMCNTTNLLQPVSSIPDEVIDSFSDEDTEEIEFVTSAFGCEDC